MHESQMYYAELKKPDSKGYLLYELFILCSRKGKTIGTKNRPEVAKGQGWRNGVDCKEAQSNLF